MIVCAAVVGQSNNPLYIKCFVDGGAESSLKFHYIIHCSLDAVEEKVMGNFPKNSPTDDHDCFLGLLYPTENYKVYGYITNTSTKFILVVDDMIIKEDDIKLIFRKIHQAYVHAISNPFYTMGTPLQSRTFDARLRALSKGPA